MKKWSLRKRIGVGFGLLCLTLIVLGSFALVRLRVVGRHASDVSSLFTKQGALATEVLARANAVAISARGYDVTSDDTHWQVVESDLEHTRAAVKAIEAFSRAHGELTSLRDGLATALPAFQRYQTTLAEFRESTLAFQAQWNELVPAGGRLFEAIMAVTTQLEQASTELAKGGSAAAVHENVVLMKLLADAFRDAAEVRMSCWRVVGTQDPQHAVAANARAKVAALKLLQLKERSRSAAIVARLDEAIAALRTYEQGTLRLKDAIDHKLAARDARTTAYGVFAAAVKTIQQGSTNLVDAGATDTTARVSSLMVLLVIGGAVAVVIGIATAVIVTRQTNRVLSHVAQILSENSEQTASSSDQVSSASQTLANGASEQAASLEETSASLEELSSMTKRNVESAEQAKTLSDQTRLAAETGAKDMRQMEAAMDAIKTSSDGIAKIIKAIDEIAFQTNILALNAAVEAARAGEAGMGFAVVADEVRNLAQRSAHASKETAQKIEEAISNSEAGVRISHAVAKSLGEIVEKARRMDTLVGEIVLASTEQSQGLTQVNTAVGQMDRVTQSNASSAEETAAAAEQLKEQASVLRTNVAELLALVHGVNEQTAALAQTRRAEPVAGAAGKPARIASQAAPRSKPAPHARSTPELTFEDVDPRHGASHRNGNKSAGADLNFEDFTSRPTSRVNATNGRGRNGSH